MISGCNVNTSRAARRREGFALILVLLVLGVSVVLGTCYLSSASLKLVPVLSKFTSCSSPNPISS